MKEQTLELFRDFGELKNIKKVKQPGEKKITAYSYSFDMKYLMEEAEGVKVNFLLVDQGDLVSLANFGIDNDILDDEKVLAQLNYANTQMLYGKFLIDEDNDVHWEYSFEPSKASKEYILAIVSGFISGLKALLSWTGAEIDE